MADGESVSRADVDYWVDSVSRMYGGEDIDPGDYRAADHAAGMLMSGWGLLVPLPSEVVEMIRQAIVTGYAAALSDVCGGKFDAEIEMWRDLTPR